MPDPAAGHGHLRDEAGQVLAAVDPPAVSQVLRQAGQGMCSAPLAFHKPLGDRKLGLDQQHARQTDDPGEQILGQQGQIGRRPDADAAAHQRQRTVEHAPAGVVLQVIEQVKKSALIGQFFAGDPGI